MKLLFAFIMLISLFSCKSEEDELFTATGEVTSYERCSTRDNDTTYTWIFGFYVKLIPNEEYVLSYNLSPGSLGLEEDSLDYQKNILLRSGLNINWLISIITSKHRVWNFTETIDYPVRIPYRK